MSARESRLPPVTELGMASLALIIIGGIYLAANLPKDVTLGPAIALLAASAVLLGTNMLLLARTREFKWQRFFEVAKWAFLAYILIAALIEFSFVHNGTEGGPLVILSLSLVIFALHVPILIGFTVARYA